MLRFVLPVGLRNKITDLIANSLLRIFIIAEQEPNRASSGGGGGGAGGGAPSSSSSTSSMRTSAAAARNYSSGASGISIYEWQSFLGLFHPTVLLL